MKTILKNLVFVVFLGFGLMVTTQSCTDECKDVTCQNGGTCDEGDCSCADGYSGDNCEIEDLCVTQSVVCQNGGTCDAGICACLDGFEGTNCETISRDKFKAVYNVAEDCHSGVYQVEIIESSTSDITKVLITGDFGFFDCPPTGYTLEATIVGSTITLPSQSACGNLTFVGSGTINTEGNIVTINYEVTFDDNGTVTTDQCKATLTKV